MFADMWHFSPLSIKVLVYSSHTLLNELFIICLLHHVFLDEILILVVWNLSQLAFTLLVYPSLILAYMGKAAYLSKHHEDIQRSFYKAIPGKC